MSSDFNFNGVSDQNDADLFLENWVARHPSADYNADGVIDDLDVATFVPHFLAGE